MALGASDADIQSLAPKGHSGSNIAEAVKQGLLAYHKHAEVKGAMFPFPGACDDHQEMEEEDMQKLKTYITKLDSNHPSMLLDPLWKANWRATEEEQIGKNSSIDTDDPEHEGSPASAERRSSTHSTSSSSKKAHRQAHRATVGSGDALRI